MSEIEISEADREAAACLIEMATAANAEGMPLKDRHEIWHQAFARHRLAATAAVEARVADAVRAERERILNPIKWRRDAYNEAGRDVAAIALEHVILDIESKP